ncbi:hypothetical protein Tco_1228261 [Tanacetum coccineum]
MDHQTSSVPQIAYHSPQVSIQPMIKFPQLDSGVAIPIFTQRDDPISCLNKATAFLWQGLLCKQGQGGRTSYARLRLYGRNATCVRGNNAALWDRLGLLNVIMSRDGHMARQCTQPKRPRKSRHSRRSSCQKTIPNNAAFQTEDLNAYDSDCDDVSTAQAVLMANLSNYGSNIIMIGSRDTNLYTVSLDDMLKTSSICLLSKSSKSKRWLWHRRLSHLNFACALGKSKKSSHQPKAEDTNQEKLYLLHMDLCIPMRVESINLKKSKDEAPDAIIKCIKNIQVHLNATVRNVRTDNGTEFVN